MAVAMFERFRWALLWVAALVVVSLAATGCGAASPSFVAAAPAPPPPPAEAAAAARDEPDARYQGAFGDDGSREVTALPVVAEAKGLLAGKALAPAKPHAPASTVVSVPGTTSAQAGGSQSPPTQAPAPHRESLIVYTATMEMAVYQVDASLTRIEEMARGVGGYLASRNDSSIVVRVPRARFQEVLAEVAKAGEVLHREVQAQDVSDQVVDLEARLRNARVVRERLAQLLQGATATKDALEIERELARVMADIESMEGKLQLLADRVAYSTLTVRFQPLHVGQVHNIARLPYAWLEDLGLASLLRVK